MYSFQTSESVKDQLSPSSTHRDCNPLGRGKKRAIHRICERGWMDGFAVPSRRAMPTGLGWKVGGGSEGSFYSWVR